MSKFKTTWIGSGRKKFDFYLEKMVTFRVRSLLTARFRGVGMVLAMKLYRGLSDILFSHRLNASHFRHILPHVVFFRFF